MTFISIFQRKPDVLSNVGIIRSLLILESGFFRQHKIFPESKKSMYGNSKLRIALIVQRALKNAETRKS